MVKPRLLTASLLLIIQSLRPAAALSLEEAVSRTLRHHELARAAEQEALAAAARVGRARALLLPTLRLDEDWTRRGPGASSISRSEGLESSLTLRQTLFSARALPLLSQARHGRRAAELQAAATRRGLAYATADAFLAALAAEQVARAAGRRRDLAQRALEEIRVRFGAQLAGSNDVTRAELEAANAEREGVRAAGAARVARLDLENLLGGPAADSLETPATLLEQAALPPALPATAEAAARRPDLAAARERLLALEAAAREPLARWVPDLGMTASAVAAEDESLADARDNWTLALALGWPLFDGGGREADRAECRALARSARLQLQAQERGVGVELESARAAQESAQASLARARVAVEAAGRNAGETADLYRRGLARALEVMDAHVQLFEAEVEQVRAQAELASACLGLRHAAGLDPIAEEASP